MQLPASIASNVLSKSRNQGMQLLESIVDSICELILGASALNVMSKSGNQGI